jgi:hypothetical protein
VFSARENRQAPRRPTADQLVKTPAKVKTFRTKNRRLGFLRLYDRYLFNDGFTDLHR